MQANVPALYKHYAWPMLSSDHLVQLLNDCARGDSQALARLYRATAPQLFAIALRIVRRRDSAEDVLQESFVNIWNHARDYREDKGAPLAWMTTIVRRRCIDSLRRLQHENLADDNIDEEQWPDPDPTPLEQLVRHREGALLRQCLEGLQAKQRDSIVLAYYHGLTHEQLARHMNCPLGTVKSWVRRGLEALKGCLER